MQILRIIIPGGSKNHGIVQKITVAPIEKNILWVYIMINTVKILFFSRNKRWETGRRVKKTNKVFNILNG